MSSHVCDFDLKEYKHPASVPISLATTKGKSTTLHDGLSKGCEEWHESSLLNEVAVTCRVESH